MDFGKLKRYVPKTRRGRIVFVVAAVLSVGYYFCLPRDLFPDTKWSTVVVDRNGELLGARIADDGQWRFPVSGEREDEISAGKEKYRTALIEFEDRWFRWHWGVNPVSICKALYINTKSGHIVSGGSTISMQVIRLSRRKERTLWQKITEAVLATRLEFRYSKDRILQLYESHAPFGGNVVGLEAAAWRYFGRPSSELSWGEAATLAVLPNSPSSIRPGRNRDRLVQKRNRLLKRLNDRGFITEMEYLSAVGEPLPDEPEPLPSYAHHYVDDIAGKNSPERGHYVKTDIDLNLQRRVEECIDRKSDDLAAEGISDLAAVVVDVASGEVIAYCGNSSPYRKRAGVNVNIARSPRSSGSILKPFLYCDALDDGTILPYSLLADTPVNINGFTPQNYNLTYDGAVPASQALSRSLNVPTVHLLKAFGTGKFLENLKARGLTSFDRSASDYGLSLILGGGECRLDEVTAAYADMARAYMTGEAKDIVPIFYTLEALKEVNRPDEIDWHIIRSVKKVAWKTGTSYGYRDAWAVGVTPSYAVGIWAGNASGNGAPALIGARTAGPVMFEIFNMLPASSPDWFPSPEMNPAWKHPVHHAEVCVLSGFLAGPDCIDKTDIMIPDAGERSAVCPYHFQENGHNVFRLTPAMEWFYRQRHPEYDSTSGTSVSSETPIMEFIYPENGSRITLARQNDGTLGDLVLNLAHHVKNATVYWHLDQKYIGETRFIHQMTVRPSSGKHSITAVDDSGNSLSIVIDITDTGH